MNHSLQWDSFLSFLLLNAYCLHLVQNGIGLTGETAAESPQDHYTLPGKQTLVHISAWNRAEREAVALVFSVSGSWIELLFMEGSGNLAKGQLVLYPVLTPFCLLLPLVT